MAVVNDEKYKPNSFKSKAEAEERRKEKIIKGQARVHQKTTSEKIKEAIFGENVDSVGDYLIFDILVPSCKELVSDFISKGVDMMLFGETRGRGRSNSRRGGSYVDYTATQRKRDHESARRARFDFSDVEFDIREDAIEVLDAMDDNIEMYDDVSVANLYEFSGITPSPADYNWGWTNINAARIELKRNGKYIIVMPRPKALR